MQQTATNTKLLNNMFWPFLMFTLGMLMVINQSVGFDLAVMPGELVDGRFNNYILEHGYQYFTNKGMPYWNAPFFFPEKDVISYSDNLFGALPIYVFCRMVVDRETAFQLWYLILIAFNFIGAYYAIRKLKVSVYASSVGAFIYAFSLLLMIQTAHIQLLPRFVAPFAIVSFYLWLQGNGNKYFYISVFLLVYQFYCGIYIGYFLMYVLIAMVCIYLVRERNVTVIFQLFNSKANFLRTSAFLFLVISLFAGLFYHYYLRSIDGDGYPSMDVLKGFTPRLWSYIFSVDRSIMWGWLDSVVKKGFNPPGFSSGESHLFIGIIPLVLVVASFIMYRKDSGIRFFLITLIVIFILTLTVFGFSLYPYVASLIPGARAIRVVARYLVIAVFLYSVVSAFFLDRFLSNSNKYTILVIIVLPILLVMDNIQFAKEHGPQKRNFQKRSKLIVEKYNKQKNKNPDAKAFAYVFNLDSVPNEDLKKRMTAQMHVDAMMASQLIGLPCVNGYSAKAPPDYMDYFLKPNEKQISAWLNSTRIKSTVKKEYDLDDILIVSH